MPAISARRRCGFCDVMTAKPSLWIAEEPTKIAEAVALMGLRFAVITGVARDDLDDAGVGSLGRSPSGR